MRHSCCYWKNRRFEGRPSVRSVDLYRGLEWATSFPQIVELSATQTLMSAVSRYRGEKTASTSTNYTFFQAFTGEGSDV